MKPRCFGEGGATEPRALGPVADGRELWGRSLLAFHHVKFSAHRSDPLRLRDKVRQVSLESRIRVSRTTPK